MEGPWGEVGKLVDEQGRASKGVEQCQGAGLGSECPLRRSAVGLRLLLGLKGVLGSRGMPMSPSSMGTQGPWGLSSAWLCGLQQLCWQAAELYQAAYIHECCAHWPLELEHITKGTSLTLFLIPRSCTFKPELPCI